MCVCVCVCVAESNSLSSEMEDVQSKPTQVTKWQVGEENKAHITIKQTLKHLTFAWKGHVIFFTQFNKWELVYSCSPALSQKLLEFKQVFLWP